MVDFWKYLTLPFLWQGLLTAIELTVLSFAIALPLSIVVALMRLSKYRWLRLIPWPFVWVMRGTPLLLQLIFWFDVLPLMGMKVNPFTTAVVSLVLNEIAFSAEIIKGGISAVKHAQREAGMSVGMSSWTILQRIVLPQAARSIAPAMGNELIIMLKNTSLASVIAVDELTLRSQQIVAVNFKYLTVFGAAGLLYLIASTAVTILQSRIERRLDIEGRVVPLVSPDAGRAREAGQAGSVILRGLRNAGLAHRLDSSEQIAGAGHAAGAGSTEKTDSGGTRHAKLIEQVSRELLSDRQASAEPFLQIKNVGKSFGGLRILNGVSIDVKAGEVVVILGPSGSGKTTLLRTINHLEVIDSGEITVAGQLVGYRRTEQGVVPLRSAAKGRRDARVGFVFQHFNLFEHRTVLQNIIEAPVRVYKRPVAEAEAEARELLDWAGLSGHEDHYPHQLSGGQRQRIAIARSLACRPRLMLFDEPTSALDPELVGQVLSLIRGLGDLGMTMVIVTHEMAFAEACADRVIYMEGGVVVEEGTPGEIFKHPRDERTRRFLRMIDERAGTEETVV